MSVTTIIEQKEERLVSAKTGIFQLNEKTVLVIDDEALIRMLECYHQTSSWSSRRWHPRTKACPSALNTIDRKPNASRCGARAI